MIDKMGFDEHRIFDVQLSKNKRFLTFREACDGFFDADLNKQQIIELANDLLAIANEMIEPVEKSYFETYCSEHDC